MRNSYNLLFILVCLNSCISCQNVKHDPSKLQYPVNYPKEVSALDQIHEYPLPRYHPGNHLQRLFNWMDPGYLGSNGQPGVSHRRADSNSYSIQKELITNWNYGVIIPNAGCAFQGPRYGSLPYEIRLANEYPNVSLDVITFWTQGSPAVLGYKTGYPMIRDDKIDAPYAITFTRDGQQNTEIKFNFPDSLIRIDGRVQKYYLSEILKVLKRPINRINENGEEDPQVFLENYIQNDPAMKGMKDSMKINSWHDFVSIRKLQMRNVFSSEFMKGLPELENTQFSFYIVEGGPIDRFDWHIMKKCMTPINGRYYSTPDFYPRWPKNWKDWQGAWHGWKWISIGRNTEIKDGDRLFSPFVAAGWSKNDSDNITPGQWLGLLKCLSVIGAEFYYVGYFNLSAPFNNPADYIWQAAMPAYAQAITSRYEDVLKNGNVLFDNDKEPIISYSSGDRHILVTARKANNKEKYVICGTYQPFSNDSDEIPESKNVSVTIDGHNLSFEARRQGSVYIYEKTPDNRTIFYQLDKWHENAHPEHWSKDFRFEAEVADSGVSEKDIYTENANGDGNYIDFTSYVKLNPGNECVYHYTERDSTAAPYYVWIRYRGAGNITLKVIDNKERNIQISNDLNSANWQWKRIPMSSLSHYAGNNTFTIKSRTGTVDLDKFIITTKTSL
jgi:hypothetical protein